MNPALEPSTPQELSEAVRSAPRVLVVGAGTKPRPSAIGGVTRISTARLTGIVEYEPSEYTFTALAGTTLREIEATLGERGQGLPFDPPFSEAGATLGGTVAAGLSGPGRYRYGGLRDFILGVRFVDGQGRLLRLGGKVVKNAAGFDLPRFLVGSLGRLGALAELTFKVFPQVAQSLTLALPGLDGRTMTALLGQAGSSRWELDALEFSPDEALAYVRLRGPVSATEAIARELLQRWPGRQLDPAEADECWRGLAAFTWSHPGGLLVKVPISPAQLEPYVSALHDVAGARAWVGAGGNVLYVSLAAGAATEPLEVALRTLRASALTLRGTAPLWPGVYRDFAVFRAIKTALDEPNRFPGLHD